MLSVLHNSPRILDHLTEFRKFCMNFMNRGVEKLLNEELNNLYDSPNIVRVMKSRIMKWAGHVSCMWEGRGMYRVLVGKHGRKRPLGRPRRRWEDNIKMDLQEVGCGGYGLERVGSG